MTTTKSLKDSMDGVLNNIEMLMDVLEELHEQMVSMNEEMERLLNDN